MSPPTAATLRAGDILDVALTTVPPREYSELEVSATGTLHVPGLGDFAVRGLSIAEAEAQVRTRLQRLDSIGEIHLRRSSVSSGRFRVLGAVGRQGVYPVRAGLRLSGAIGAAGGLATTKADPAGTGQIVLLADLSEAALIRNGSVLPIDFDRAVQGDPQHDVPVQSGDYIRIPMRERRTVSVLGRVRTPLVLQHWGGMRLTQALALAGGVTAEGDKQDIRIVRGPVDRPQVYSADLRAIVEGARADVALAPGDVLFVTDHGLEDVGEVLALLAPFGILMATASFLVLASAP